MTDQQKEAVRELIAAYDAFAEANQKVKQFAPRLAWPQPTIQPGGADSKEWRRRVAHFENQD